MPVSRCGSSETITLPSEEVTATAGRVKKSESSWIIGRAGRGLIELDDYSVRYGQRIYFISIILVGDDSTVRLIGVCAARQRPHRGDVAGVGEGWEAEAEVGAGARNICTAAKANTLTSANRNAAA